MALARSSTLRFSGRNRINSSATIEINFSVALMRSFTVIWLSRSLNSSAPQTSVKANSDVSKLCPDRWRANHSLSGSRTSSFTMMAESRYILPFAARPTHCRIGRPAMNRLFHQVIAHAHENFPRLGLANRRQQGFRLDARGDGDFLSAGNQF